MLGSVTPPGKQLALLPPPPLIPGKLPVLVVLAPPSLYPPIPLLIALSPLRLWTLHLDFNISPYVCLSWPSD